MSTPTTPSVMSFRNGADILVSDPSNIISTSTNPDDPAVPIRLTNKSSGDEFNVNSQDFLGKKETTISDVNGKYSDNYKDSWTGKTFTKWNPSREFTVTAEVNQFARFGTWWNQNALGANMEQTIKVKLTNPGTGSEMEMELSEAQFITQFPWFGTIS